MKALYILFITNILLSIITLWSLTESLILYSNVYKTVANITEVNQSSIKFYILKKRCDYIYYSNCDKSCLEYEKSKYYEIWCDCLTGKCDLIQQKITQLYLTRIYIGWGLYGFLLLAVISIITYICGSENGTEIVKKTYRCISCLVFLLCLILFSIGFVYSNGSLQ